MNDSHNVIVYVPGMKPKPEPAEHRPALWRCLLEGVRRADRAVAAELAGCPDVFRLVAWSHLFYHEPRDLSLDLPGIERLLELDGPEERDIRESLHWHRRLGRLVYLACDAFPFLIDLVANPDMKATLQDSQRYFRNENGVASRIRRMVSDTLVEASESGSRILLIGHSLGSVIAYDVLWELSENRTKNLQVDCFMTLGSPLGMNFIQHRVLSGRARGVGEHRYPNNIRRWSNLSAIGEMTALDRVFADDYREMLDLGLVESIDDRTDLRNYFRGSEGLNVHRCYGYMVNEKTGEAIVDWWRGGKGPLSA